MNKITFDNLLQVCTNNYKNNDSINKIKEAYFFAVKNHEGR